eukprot:5604137-Prymnesium_polylepis.1
MDQTEDGWVTGRYHTSDAGCTMAGSYVQAETWTPAQCSRFTGRRPRPAVRRYSSRTLAGAHTPARSGDAPCGRGGGATGVVLASWL